MPRLPYNFHVIGVRFQCDVADLSDKHKVRSQSSELLRVGVTSNIPVPLTSSRISSPARAKLLIAQQPNCCTPVSNLCTHTHWYTRHDIQAHDTTRPMHLLMLYHRPHHFVCSPGSNDCPRCIVRPSQS
jgi:hypothetical protein